MDPHLALQEHGRPYLHPHGNASGRCLASAGLLPGADGQAGERDADTSRLLPDASAARIRPHIRLRGRTGCNRLKQANWSLLRLKAPGLLFQGPRLCNDWGHNTVRFFAQGKRQEPDLPCYPWRTTARAPMALGFLQKILATIGQQTLSGYVSGILAGQTDRQEGHFFRFPPPGERISIARGGIKWTAFFAGLYFGG